jgi:hypothetical protein
MLKTAGFTIVDVVEFRGGNVEDVLPRLREGAVKLLQST